MSEPGGRPRPASRITSRDDRFQQWQALLANRNKRQRSGQFLVQGVRPITLAVRHGWTIRALLYDEGRALSDWAVQTVAQVPAAEVVAMDRALLQELGGKSEDAPELLAVVALPPDDLDRIRVLPGAGASMDPATPAAFLGVVFDRPTSPGNIGTLVRSADAFGASGVMITGHAADVYDPKAVRASTGSLFAIPVVRAPSHREVLDWASAARAGGVAITVVGLDEAATTDIADQDLRGPTLLLVGNETHGLSAAWREACQHLVRIPMQGAASSLNAAACATVALYEVARQRAARAR
jgi:tRNA G18 (ribose-2'-O)-methylase SpoU